MDNITPELLSISPLAIIVIFAIKEIFSYLKSRKNNFSSNYEKELALINEKLSNHIIHFQEDFTEAKKDIKTIKDDIVSIKIGITKIEASLTIK